MKYITLILAVVAAFLLVSPSFAADPFFDADFEKYEKEYSGGLDACWKLKSNRDRSTCKVEFKEKLAGDPRKRGSEEYFLKHYAPLDFKALDNKYLELIVLQKKAQSYGFASGKKRPKGVVSAGILQAEISYVYQLQAERQFANICEEDKARTKRLDFSLSSLSPDCQQYFAEKAVEEQLKKRGLN